MIPQARRPRARTPEREPLLNRLPPEYRPYMRRVVMLIVLAAALGVALALIIPAPHR
jgi:hypothetical protein